VQEREDEGRERGRESISEVAMRGKGEREQEWLRNGASDETVTPPVRHRIFNRLSVSIFL
jgi:hypothetical protein